MKTSSPAPFSSDEDTGEDETEATSTEPPRSSSDEPSRGAAPRPSLLKSSPARLSEVSPPARDGGEGVLPSDETEGISVKRHTPSTGNGGGEVPSKPAIMRMVSGTEQEKLAKLKEAVNAKLMQQQRKRGSYGAKRISPIKEEDHGQMSPSLTAAFASPTEAAPRPLSTVSTESTESAKTVRANITPIPAEGKALRTPSYPFPYVPGTPRTWSSNFHQPFTTLSPTVKASSGKGEDTPRSASFDLLSGVSSPAGTARNAMSSAGNCEGLEDPRFPTPNLYDMILQLNAEPGLEQWWATVTNLMHDHFKAERVTLAVPLDPTDIENVPWGQRATFSMNGPQAFDARHILEEQTSDAHASGLPWRGHHAIMKDFQMQKLHPERLRPKLDARHSYAGPPTGRDGLGGGSAEGRTRRAGRPPGPTRNHTHASGMTSAPEAVRQHPQRLPSSSSVNIHHTSISDSEFSSVAGAFEAGPYAEIFINPRALDHEVRPLIESGGVQRVLDRGKVVAVTRDYVSESSGSSNTHSASDLAGDSTSEDVTPQNLPAIPPSARMFGNYRGVLASESLRGFHRDYEEYEQVPASPWAQSPAPSPAIQADEDSNPFFASEEQQVEDSFNPSSGTPRDYSQLGQVEAIGVDRASTVTHIPLIHPSLSQPMQSLKMRGPTEVRGVPQRSNTVDLERKAPIAILSLLSSTVPYPPNLTQSLKLLGPHLATSFAIAQQFSSINPQAITIRHRRTASGHNVTEAPMTIEPASLEDIVNAELEEPLGSMSGSITSPSDYSGRSRHSPSGSIVGTPGWDPASHGWTTSKSVAGTPAFTVSDMVDNYFEAKKRSAQRTSSNASASAHATPAKSSGAKPPSSENRPSARKPSPQSREDAKQQHGEQRLKSRSGAKEDQASLRLSRESSPTRTADGKLPQRPSIRHAVSHFVDQSAADAARRHSLLHSYGADFESSFGPAPSPVMTPGHARRASYNEDMPPPSERLLRTIIDSVPVQIFTAKPETGQLSWVNSKFLIYRGQEARTILSDPWHAIHPDDRTEFLASWHRSLRTAQQLQQKVRLERFDGSFRWFYVRAAPLKDKRQKIVHWIGTMMDFHEQHLAETNAARQQETEASEAKYRALANSSPQIVFAVNKIKGVIFCNTQWVHFSGQTEGQALGLGFMDHVHPDDLAKCKLPNFDGNIAQATNVPTSVPPEIKRTNTTSATSSSGSSETERGAVSSESSSPVTNPLPQRKLSELAETGILKVSRDADGRPFYSTEVRLRSKEDEYRWHLVRVLLADSFTQHLQQEEETWYGTCTDINDHKTLERDLKETMDEKSRFLSNMSHEIRTPLNGIMGMVNFLIDSSLTSEQMEHVNIIRASTEGLRGLINDILDLSKAEAGMIHLSYDWLYVRALIEEVNDLTSAMAIDKGLELNYLVEENVPAQIKGDRFRVRQILLNIIGNAIKFTVQGEVFVRCSVMTSRQEELAGDEMFIKFDIIDTGRGFNEREAEHLFKRFSQIDGSSTRQHGGTGLGLVISRQLAHLHGGDMSAKGIPGKGSTFSFFIKSILPSTHDQPPMPPPTSGIPHIPILPMSSELIGTPTPAPKTVSLPSGSQARPSPKFLTEISQTPSPFLSPGKGRESPSASSASSDPSVTSAGRTESLRSERSSASSYVPDPIATSPAISLSIPESVKKSDSPSAESMVSSQSGKTMTPTSGKEPISRSSSGRITPPMFSILVVCPLRYSREATVQHIDKTLPSNIPHQITAREHLLEAQKILGGDDPVRFTHVVVFLQDVQEILALMDQILSSPAHSSTIIVIITDLSQRRSIMEKAPQYHYEQLHTDRRVRFVFKPLKPSRFGVIFDPQKEREMSTDRNQDSAQAVAVSQKQVFEQLKQRLGNRDMRVLLVEDNRVNQMVILKFLAKVDIAADTALDGVQCTDKVFVHSYGYYDIILCDLHMPNKDGYQTCKEIRRWEKKNDYRHLPIIALSANVLGDVYEKCVDAGFNSYITKPVDFKELSQVLMTFMDPIDPTKPHELMRKKKGSRTPHR